MYNEAGGNGEMTEKEKAIREKRICGMCKWRLPGHAPILLPIPNPPGTLVRPQTITAVPILLCSNPHSENFMKILGINCSCEVFENAKVVNVVENVPKKIADRLKG